MRARLLLLALFALPLAAQSGPEPGTGGSAGGGGVTSPVTTDPISFTGVETHDNAANTPATFADGLKDSLLTAGRCTFAGAAGLLTDDADCTFATDTLTATKIVGTTSVTTAAVAVPSAGAADAVQLGETAGCATFEGPTADAFKTRVCGGDATVSHTMTVLGTSDGVEIRGDATSNIMFAPVGGYQVMEVEGVSVGSIKMRATTIFCWAAGLPSAACDIGLERITTAVARVTNGGAITKGWLQQEGNISLAADFTNATATMANTALSVPVIAGETYAFEVRLFTANSVAAEGIKIDFDGGNATATDFRVHCKISDTALLLSTQTTALATDVAVALMTGAALVECSGSLEVNAGGTFIVRAAENSTATGTLTVRRGSWIKMDDTTP